MLVTALLCFSFMFAAILFFYIGLYCREISQKIDALLEDRQKNEPEPFVTPTNPSFANEGMAGNEEESIIVTPKSPQLLEWEESEKLRKMNLRPR